MHVTYLDGYLDGETDMTTKKITIVRIYLNTDHAGVNVLLKRLHDWEKIRGVTVFEALTGFGKSGLPPPNPETPTPKVVEFFDYPEKARRIIEDISGFIASEHIIFWDAELTVGSKGTA